MISQNLKEEARSMMFSVIERSTPQVIRGLLQKLETPDFLCRLPKPNPFSHPKAYEFFLIEGGDRDERMSRADDQGSYDDENQDEYEGGGPNGYYTFRDFLQLFGIAEFESAQKVCYLRRREGESCVLSWGPVQKGRFHGKIVELIDFSSDGFSITIKNLKAMKVLEKATEELSTLDDALNLLGQFQDNVSGQIYSLSSGPDLEKTLAWEDGQWQVADETYAYQVEQPELDTLLVTYNTSSADAKEIQNNANETWNLVITSEDQALEMFRIERGDSIVLVDMGGGFSELDEIFKTSEDGTVKTEVEIVGDLLSGYNY